MCLHKFIRRAIRVVSQCQIESCVRSVKHALAAAIALVPVPVCVRVTPGFCNMSSQHVKQTTCQSAVSDACGTSVCVWLTWPRVACVEVIIILACSRQNLALHLGQHSLPKLVHPFILHAVNFCKVDLSVELLSEARDWPSITTHSSSLLSRVPVLSRVTLFTESCRRRTRGELLLLPVSSGVCT
jgi:hypothetical protein